MPAGGHDFIPNGFALLPDGTFLIANMGHDGGVWARRPGGRVEPYLMEADGERLAKANFVFNDEQGRVWITVTTRSDPLSKAMTGLGRPELKDGFVCMVDGKGARIVARALPSPTRRGSIRAAASSTWWKRKGAGSRGFASAHPATSPAARPSRTSDTAPSPTAWRSTPKVISG